MKKTLTLLAASLLLAAPVLADTQPAAPQSTENAGGVNLNLKGISVNLGGFIEAAGIYRTRNLNSDMSSKFQSLPLSSQTGYYQDETRFSARQSRLSILAKGDYNPEIHLAGYYEMDFLGAGVTSNNNQSNSYTMRQRQVWGQAAYRNWTVTGGQMWSLVTETKKGVDNRTEALPMTIDAQYTVGFSWARQFGFRVAKNFNNRFWLAAALDTPNWLAMLVTSASPVKCRRMRVFTCEKDRPESSMKVLKSCPVRRMNTLIHSIRTRLNSSVDDILTLHK